MPAFITFRCQRWVRVCVTSTVLVTRHHIPAAVDGAAAAPTAPPTAHHTTARLPHTNLHTNPRKRSHGGRGTVTRTKVRRMRTVTTVILTGTSPLMLHAARVLVCARLISALTQTGICVRSRLLVLCVYVSVMYARNGNPCQSIGYIDKLYRVLKTDVFMWFPTVELGHMTGYCDINSKN